MKKYNIISTLILGVFLFNACESFLDTPPKSNQTIDQYYQDEKEAEQAVNGIYNWLGSKFSQTAYGESPAVMLEFPTGLARFSEGQQSLINPDLEKLIYWDRLYVDTWWQSSYYAIEACNLAIDGMSRLPETDNLSRMRGEVYFMRAYHYFNLVRIFGNVPLKLSITEKPADAMLTKSSVLEIYEEAIIPSLEEAGNCKVSNEPSSGRVSAEAVNALFAQVYLTMAGSPLNQTDKYALAAEKARLVINSGKFNLFMDDVNNNWFEKLRNKNFDNQGEYVFMVNFGPSPAPRQYYSIMMIPMTTDRIIGARGFGSLMPRVEFINSFEAGDLRSQEKGFFFSRYPDFEDPETILDFETCIYKYFDPTMPGQGGYSDKSLGLIRYAEIMLAYAEAQAQAGTIDDLAVSCVNQIRTRAGLTEISSAVRGSKDLFIEEVIKQRTFELCYENVTFYDMVRTQKAWDVQSKSLVNLNGYTLPGGAVFDPAKHTYFPVPLREIQINPELRN